MSIPNDDSGEIDLAQLEKLEALFQAALAVPAERREQFLHEHTADAQLRAEVLRLLQWREARPTLRNTPQTGHGGDDAPTPRRIGNYRVIRELGVGGMGTVLLAERLLGDTPQKVALKLIRGFPTAQARERLARERALLAELNHPNIARLLDAGETRDHVPYIAMEYVEGISLQAFCAAHALNIAARLRLFVQLCRAVQHAHQRLIVHRDIKPGNILVRTDGTPVLLDFGIGKLLDDSARDDTATHVFTPAYAAPEQIAGRAVTTATDIFGLGCVLHELLTGRALHEVRQGGRIPPPSTSTRDTTQARTLRGDLDTLTTKALHAEPERRYASAQALADDVGNYLAGRPLAAAPDSFTYRTRKFLARHRYAALGVAAMTLFAIVFVWRLETERERAQRAELRAQHEAQSTRRSRDFLVSLFQAAAPGNTLGRALSARELIDKGSERLSQELKDEPDSAARVGLTIAEVYAALGDPKAAIASGEKALALAAGDTPQRALLRADILLVLGSEYDNTERFDDARRADEQALRLRETFAPDDRLKIAMTLADLGNAATRRGDDAVARAYFDRAIPAFASLPNVDPVEQANVLRGLADVDMNEGKSADSIVHAQQALAVLAPLPAQSPERIGSWRALARAQIAHGEAADGTAVLEHALDVAYAALGPDSGKVSNVENDLAVALNAQGRYRDAISHLEKAIAIDSKLRPGERAATAFSVLNLGSIYESLGDYAKAEALMRQGIAAMEAETPDEPQLDFFRGNLARTLMFRGQLREARELIERALTGIAAHDGDKSFGYGFQVYRLARIELAAGNMDAAAQALRDCEHILDAQLPAQHGLRVQLDVVRGSIAQARGDYVVAQREFQAAETMQLALNDADHVTLAVVRERLAGALLARGEISSARNKLGEALPVLEQALMPGAVELIEARALAAQLQRRAES
jgi:tetratricopeptide (TPR) repeat protein